MMRCLRVLSIIAWLLPGSVLADPMQYAHGSRTALPLRGGQPDTEALHFFADPRSAPNFGFSADRWWAKTTVPTATPPAEFLRWDSPTANRLVVFLRCGKAEWRAVARMRARFAFFYLGPAAGGCDLLLLEETYSAVHFDITFLTAAAASETDDSTLVGISLGVAAGAGLLGIALWAATRRRELIHFALYQLASCGVILDAWGFVPMIVPIRNTEIADFLGILALNIWVYCYLNFVRYSLRFDVGHPRTNRLIDALGISIALVMLLHPLRLAITPPWAVFNIEAPLVFFVIIIISQWKLERARVIAQLVGFAPSLGCSVMFILFMLGHARLSDMRGFFLEGQIASTLVLGFWIAREFKQDRDRREATLTETVRQLEANSAELERYQGDLEALVAGRTAELQRALANERAIVAQQRDFTAMIGHEFRTPLAVIDGQANRISRATPEQADLPRRSREIREAVRDMIGLMDGLLFHARHESGHTEYRFETVALRDSLDRAVDIGMPRDRLADVRLDCSPDLACRADHTLLATAIGNILGNAAKYSAAGSPIAVAARAIAGQLELNIEDKGVGIAAEELQTVFARFQRGSNVLTTSGSGLGLFIARQIIEGHGGHILVASTQGQGTRFTVTLPAVGSPGLAAAALSRSA